MAPVELVDVSLGAAQHALLVSRLRQRHAVPVAELLEGCHLGGIEIMGAPGFEAGLRFLAENPFDRIRALRTAAPTTTLLASIGGQALVGHRHAPDDVVTEFMRAAAAAGIGLFRIHDPLNDVRNLARPVAAARESGAEVEGVIVYGDFAGVNSEVIEVARAFADMGCTRLCLRDPLGVIGVARARDLVSRLREACSLPLGVAFTAQTGQADLAYLAAVEAGASRLDVALSPLAGGASFPAAEAIVAALRDTDWDTGIVLERIVAAALLLDSQLTHYADVADTSAMRLDTAALRNLLPPAAMGHALIELRDRDSLDRIEEVEAEAARIRAELGSPPRLSPIAEIIATQAVYNVCDGDRYATVSQEVKDYCLGLYGNPPTPIDADVARIVNGREEPITLRPADLLTPGVPDSRRELEREGLAASDEAVVAHALYPAEWIALARDEVTPERLGDEPPPETATPAPAEEPGGNGSPDPAAVADDRDIRDLTVEVDGQSYTVRVYGQPGSFMTNGGGGQALVNAAASVGKAVVKEGTVVAPMQGLILKVPARVGQHVEIGEVVAVLEAMKMQNDITATRSGTVQTVFVKEGAVVSPRDPIVHIE